MGKDKGTQELIRAVIDLKNVVNNIRLLLFGSFVDEETKQLAESFDCISIHGWCDREKTLELLKLSNIACWPIHHTTLIEDAIGCAIPIIVRKTGNTSHLIDKNGEYVETGKQEELISAIKKVIDNYNNYKENALLQKRKLSYDEIVSQIISDYGIVE